MIQDEEYEVVGYIKKTCICEDCMVEMRKEQFMTLRNPPQYIMKCPNCGKTEYIDCDDLQRTMEISKKGEKIINEIN